MGWTKKLQKYIFIPSASVSSFFQICSFSFVRFSPVDMEKSAAFSIHFIDTHYTTDTMTSTFITHVHSHVITFETSAAAARLKGGHQFDTIYTHLKRQNYKILFPLSNKICARPELHWHGKGSCHAFSWNSFMKSYWINVTPPTGCMNVTGFFANT